MINFAYEVFGGGIAVGVADNIEDILESNFNIVNLDEFIICVIKGEKM